MSALLVLLPPQPVTASTEFEYAVSRDGSTVDSHGAAQAALLPAAARAGAEVVALVPATMLSWHRVELPKGTSARSPRLRAVLEGLLEDRLLDEPEGLHFAIQPNARGAGPLWVATCDRAWLTSDRRGDAQSARSSLMHAPTALVRQAPASASRSGAEVVAAGPIRGLLPQPQLELPRER